MDAIIPPDIISKAKGLAILTVLKAGFIWSGRMGSGVVVARLPDGSWSAPSAIATAGVGGTSCPLECDGVVGGQIGAEVTDFVIILNTHDAVKALVTGVTSHWVYATFYSRVLIVGKFERGCWTDWT
jgi:lipid-binding SYLF domain-containing protein